eukprot:scaffold1069_cov390-Prasinococcus_capsulatus_cf.AAC.4
MLRKCVGPPSVRSMWPMADTIMSATESKTSGSDGDSATVEPGPVATSVTLRASASGTCRRACREALLRRPLASSAAATSTM